MRVSSFLDTLPCRDLFLSVKIYVKTFPLWSAKKRPILLEITQCAEQVFKTTVEARNDLEKLTRAYFFFSHCTENILWFNHISSIALWSGENAVIPWRRKICKNPKTGQQALLPLISMIHARGKTCPKKTTKSNSYCGKLPAKYF